MSSITVQPMRINLQSRHILGVIRIAQSLKFKWQVPETGMSYRRSYGLDRLMTLASSTVENQTTIAELEKNGGGCGLAYASGRLSGRSLRLPPRLRSGLRQNRAGSSLRLESGSAQDDNRRLTGKLHHYPIIAEFEKNDANQLRISLEEEFGGAGRNRTDA